MSHKKLHGNSLPGQLSFSDDWPATEVAEVPRRKAVRKMHEFTVKELRQHLELTSGQLAAEMGTTKPAIYRFESGGVSPTADWLIKLAGALGGRLRFVVDLPNGESVEMKLPPRRASVRKRADHVPVAPTRTPSARRGHQDNNAAVATL